MKDPEARYFGGRLEETSLVPLGEARLGRIDLEEWLRRVAKRQSLIAVEVDYAPGAASPSHTHARPKLLAVFTQQDGTERPFQNEY